MPRLPDGPERRLMVDLLLGGFEDWLQVLDDSRVADWWNAVEQLTDDDRDFFADTHANLFSFDHARALIDRAHGLLARDAYQAKCYAAIALVVAPRSWGSGPPGSTVVNEATLIEADAWREYAHAELRMNRYAEALAACRSARHAYALVANRERDVVYGAAILDLIRAQALHHQGRSDEALDIVKNAEDLLAASTNGSAKFVDARIIRAGILIGAGRELEALDLLEETYSIAGESADLATLAYLLGNMANVLVEMRNLDKAKACYDTAIEMFQKTGRVAEITRMLAGVTKILVQEGQTQAAIQRLYMIRRDFLQQRMPIDAAKIAVWIVSLSVESNYETDRVERLCAEAVETFTSAGLHHEAQRALAYLAAAARAGSLTKADVARASSFLDRLEDDGSVTFTPAIQ